MIVVVVGPDEEGLGAALADRGVEVRRVAGVPTAEGLSSAGIGLADLYLLTDVEEASSIPVAREHNADVRVVVYADGSLPEFARRQADLAVDPALLGPGAVAEELIREGDGTGE
ncbi:MAG: CTP synthetase [Haloferacaceae archaeon]